MDRELDDTRADVDVELLQILRCPESGSRLRQVSRNALANDAGKQYPVAGGVPILLSDYWTAFDPADAASMESSGFAPRALRAIGRWLPPLDHDLGAARAFEAFFANAPKGGHCLVIGAGDNPKMNAKIAAHFRKVTITDVVKGPAASIVCDGHELPFVDDCFDAVLIIAVLEHVISPERVVAEITRVLKPGGVVYAGTSFMQQVHMGRFDFTRFTDLGHRWLFRSYDEVLRDVGGGPGSTLAWSINYLALSFVGKSKAPRLLMRAAVRLLFFWVHWFDRLVRNDAGRDGASGVIFVGLNRKTPQLTPRELVREYRGGF